MENAGLGSRGAGSRGTGSRGVENAGSGGKRGVWWKTRGLMWKTIEVPKCRALVLVLFFTVTYAYSLLLKKKR